MKLSCSHQLLLSEARVLAEEGEALRWQFDYGRARVDPKPNALILGAWRHPNTGNNLVGAINLHYLAPQQVDRLARALPEIMKARDLYGRYHAGHRLLPDIFDNYYRTYNADYIHGVTPGVFYPKYGILKTTGKWLKRKLGGLFRTKAQRQQELQPQFPADISDIQNRLDMAIAQAQQAQVASGTIPPGPEQQATADLIQRQQQQATPMAGDELETLEDQPQDDLEHDLGEPQPEAATTQEPIDEPQSPEEAAAEFEAEREVNIADLEDSPGPGEADEQLEESIYYYSPITNSWISERWHPNQISIRRAFDLVGS